MSEIEDISTVLLVIDAQVAMLEGTGPEDPPPYRAAETIEVITGLVERARQAGAPVVFVRHHHRRFEPMQPGHPGFEVHPAFAPREGEAVIDKQACDAFCQTSLDDVLASHGATRLVVCGLQTEQCVDSVCRSAMHRGFDVALAGDGHTTWDAGPEGLTAAQIIEHTNRVLPNLPHPTHEIVVLPAAEIIW